MNDEDFKRALSNSIINDREKQEKNEKLKRKEKELIDGINYTDIFTYDIIFSNFYIKFYDIIDGVYQSLFEFSMNDTKIELLQNFNPKDSTNLREYIKSTFSSNEQNKKRLEPHQSKVQFRPCCFLCAQERFPSVRADDAISSTSSPGIWGCVHSWVALLTSQALNASTGIRILVPIFRTGNPGCLTSSYAFGRLIPIWAASSCTLNVAFSIAFSFLQNGHTKATSRTLVRMVALAVFTWARWQPARLCGSVRPRYIRSGLWLRRRCACRSIPPFASASDSFADDLGSSWSVSFHSVFG